MTDKIRPVPNTRRARLNFLIDLFNTTNNINEDSPLTVAIVTEFIEGALERHRPGANLYDVGHDIAAVRDALLDDVHQFADALMEPDVLRAIGFVDDDGDDDVPLRDAVPYAGR